VNFRKTIRFIHLWLGLVSGLVVFILGISGSILVFELEIKSLLNINREKKEVPVQDLPPAQPSEVYKNAIAVLPENKKSLYYTTGAEPNHALVTWSYIIPDTTKKEGHYVAISQDPYTGQVLNVENWNNDFFGFMTKLHYSLLLPGDIGGKITSYATLIFVVLMISGLILWYPRNKNAVKQRFKIKFNASPKRLNYDLHNVLGFYISWIAIFIAITGMLFGMEWFKNGVFFLADGGKSKVETEKIESSIPSNLDAITIDQQLRIVDSIVNLTLAQNQEHYRNHSVGFAVNAIAPINLGIFTTKGANYYRHNEFSFDQYSGKLLHAEKWEDQTPSERIQHLNYSIHIGAIGGLATKFLAFFASLFAASLPITGFLIWWGRRKKIKKTVSQY